MRAVVFGAGGMLGQALVAHLPGGWTPRWWAASPGARTATSPTPALVAAALDRLRPEVVFNAAAWTDVDGAEDHPQEARRANAEGPEVLARACAARGIHLVHYSTDFVFDGERETPYDESVAPSPQSVYAATKLEGERRVEAACPQSFVLRVGCLYGRGGRNFPSTVLRRLRAGGADPRRLRATGLAHLGGAGGRSCRRGWRAPGTLACTTATAQGETCWADFARFVADAAGLPDARVEAGGGQRPEAEGRPPPAGGADQPPPARDRPGPPAVLAGPGAGLHRQRELTGADAGVACSGPAMTFSQRGRRPRYLGDVTPPAPARPPRTLIIIPTYNEQEILPSIVEAVRDAVPLATVLIVDDNSPDGTGRAGRPAGRQGRAGAGAPPQGQGGAGRRLQAGVQAGAVRGVAAHRPDGRRFLPRPQGRPPPAGRAGRRGRPGHRLALHRWWRHPELGPGPADHQPGRGPVRARGAGGGRPRSDRRVQGLAGAHPGRHQPGRGRRQGLRVPDRDDLPGPAQRLQGGRGAHRVRRPPGGAVEDVRDRSSSRR